MSFQEYMVYKHQPNATLYELPLIAEEFFYCISNGDSLSPVDTLKDLGVKVSHDLSWTLYKSLIRSHLEYCCPLWDPSKIGDIQEI